MRAAALAACVVALGASSRAQCLDWDTTFASAGPFGPNGGGVRAMVTQHDAGAPRLVLAGSLRGAGAIASRYAVAWSAVGFTPLPGPGSEVLGMWSLDLGAGPHVYVGTAQLGTNVFQRLDGDVWTALPNPPRHVFDLTVFDSGFGPELHAIAANSFGTAPYVRRLGPGGWEPIAPGPSARPDALAVYDDGSGPALYVAGSFIAQEFGGPPVLRGLARWSAGAWVDVGGGLTRHDGSVGWPRWLILHDFGAGPRLVVAGDFDFAGGQAIRRLAAWDGSAWSAVVADLDGYITSVESVALAGGAKLAIDGSFTHVGAVAVVPPILVDGGGFQSIGAGLTSGQFNDPAVAAFEAFDDGSGVALFAAGSFAGAGGQPAGSFARFGAGGWQPLGPNAAVDGTIRAFERHDDGSGLALYAGGDLRAAGAILARQVVRYDGANWSAVGAPDTVGGVNALESADVGDGTRLYAGGWFTEISGVAANRIASWDGAQWAPLAGGGPDGAIAGGGAVIALVAHDDGTGPALYAAGYFTSVGGVPMANVARWRPLGWTPVGSGLPSTVRALAVFDDGTEPRLYAGGDALSVRRWDGTSWQPIAGPSGVLALAAYPYGPTPRLFVGGQFESVAGIATYHLAAWDGQSWSTFGSGATGFAQSRVEAFHLFDAGTGGLPRLAVGGLFGQVGGAVGANVALFDGNSWTSPSGGGVDGAVVALGSFDDGYGPAMLAAGSFVATNLTVSPGFARFGRDGSPECAPFTGASFCDGSGSGTACPCGNAGQALHGCGNSANANGARLRARGAANATDDTVTLELSGTTPNAPALYFQGTSAIANGAGSVFGDGVRCAGGSVRRLGVRQSVAGTSSFGAAAGTALVSDAGAIAGATTRTYQVWYRDPNPGFCTSSTFNLSNGVEIHWAP